MTDLQILNGCELHVHVAGCLYPEDLLTLGEAIYEEIDWTRYVESYEQAYGVHPDPHALFADALANGRADQPQFRQQVLFGEADSGDFDRFQAKFNLLGTMYVHWRQVLQREQEVLHQIVARHRREGLDYVEYRTLVGNTAADPEGFLHFHRTHAQAIQSANGHGLTARYLIGIPRDEPLTAYALVQRLFDENPELVPTIVGLDFCAYEEGYPPQGVQDFFTRLHQDNANNPQRALEVVYHVGESYFDKSLESAIRWCHQAAEMGARRLGHAIALGLDPAVAIARRPHAHEAELVSERLAQIAYDLQHRQALTQYGIMVDVASLEQEGERLQQLAGDALIERPYTPQRLAEIRHRQAFVLDQLTALGTVIESCPTSNLRIGGVPAPDVHPIHRFLKSAVNLVIGADDPGIFDSPLAAEIEWVLAHTAFDTTTLVERLGDPRRFRLGQLRPPI